MATETISSSSQLNAIYSMMESGQQSVKMERHTLLIWGITAAILILITDLLFNKESLPVRWQLITSQTVFISVILFFAGLWDFKLTRRLRQQRDESLSFIQLQMTKVWWFFVALVVLLNVGMNFFGGGYMFYGMTIALFGMAFYIHGLFSTQMLKWIGVMLIIVGVVSIALNLHFLATKWLAAGVFGLGLPMLAFILDKPQTHSTLVKRFMLSAVWVAIVILPSMLAYETELKADPNGLQTRSIAEYNRLSAEEAALAQIINIPAGTKIPVHIDMSGDIVEIKQTGQALAMKLKKDLNVVIEKGKANGHFQLDNSGWLDRIYHLRTKDFKMESLVEQDKGPSLNLNFSLEIR